MEYQLLLVGGTGIAVVLVFAFRYVVGKKREKIYPKDIVILHQFPRAKDAPSLSPFCLKLETYLRVAKIPYQNDFTLKKSPKNKMPWITYNEEVVSDSQYIIDYLNQKFNVDLNANLTKPQKAIARAMRRMLEDGFFWTVIIDRWVYSRGDPTLKILLGFNRFILWRISKMVEDQAWKQGTGRHSPQEVESIAKNDLQAVSDFMVDNKYLMGDDLCEVDCTVFAMIAMLELMGQKSFCIKFVKDNTFPKLMTYFERIKEEFWPDYTTNINPLPVQCSIIRQSLLWFGTDTTNMKESNQKDK